MFKCKKEEASLNGESFSSFVDRPKGKRRTLVRSSKILVFVSFLVFSGCAESTSSITGPEKDYSVFGKVTYPDKQAPISNVTVSIDTATDNTDINGDYQISGLSSGTHLLSFSRGNPDIFTKASYSINVGQADKSFDTILGNKQLNATESETGSIHGPWNLRRFPTEELYIGSNRSVVAEMYLSISHWYNDTDPIEVILTGYHIPPGDWANLPDNSYDLVSLFENNITPEFSETVTVDHLTEEIAARIILPTDFVLDASNGFALIARRKGSGIGASRVSISKTLGITYTFEEE